VLALQLGPALAPGQATLGVGPRALRQRLQGVGHPQPLGGVGRAQAEAGAQPAGHARGAVLAPVPALVGERHQRQHLAVDDAERA